MHHFHVDMNSGGFTGCTHQADYLTRDHLFALADVNFILGEMRKQNLGAVMLFLKTAIDTQRPSTGISLRDRPKISNFFSLYEIYPLR